MTDQLPNVLVVDDDEGTRDVFCKLLTSAGYDVQSAYDGLDAIRHMEKTPFNVVLTDVCMPHMNGLELLTNIRDRWPNSRVIVQSGIVNVQVAQRAKAEGAHAFLSKSAGTSELLNTIASASSTACAPPSEMTH
jgi:DNA-binding NtrC family response regulator